MASATTKKPDILCLSHLRWSFVFQRPNHLMRRASDEQRVFFFEEPIFDSESAELDVREESQNLFVVVPHLPRQTGEDAAEEQQRLLSNFVLARSIIDPIVWFYTPMALEYARGLHASAIVYDCMDELSAFHGAPRSLRLLESELFSRADIVFTGGQSLYEAKRAAHPNVHAFPSSVDVAHFAQARKRLPSPRDQECIERPRIGYFGVIDERIDLALLARVADERPDWQLVMVGPVVKIDPASLPMRANIHYLGHKSYDELPRYLSGWDVAMMPFAQNDATRFISPTKTLEYLAGGKPVVSTPVRDVVRPYGERKLVHVADGAGFSAAIRRALDEGFAPKASAVDAFLAQTSWDTTWRRMSALVEAELRRETGGLFGGSLLERTPVEGGLYGV